VTFVKGVSTVVEFSSSNVQLSMRAGLLLVVAFIAVLFIQAYSEETKATVSPFNKSNEVGYVLMCATNLVNVREQPCTDQAVISQVHSKTGSDDTVYAVVFRGQVKSRCGQKWIKVYHPKFPSGGWAVSTFFNICPKDVSEIIDTDDVKQQAQKAKQQEEEFRQREIVIGTPYGKTNENGLSLIRKWAENLNLCVTKNEAGQNIIGYSHVIQAGEEYPNCIDEEKAVDLLKKDVAAFEKCVDSELTIQLPPNKYSALVSWGYSVGCHNVHSAFLIKESVNQEKNDKICDEFALWRHAGGHENVKLVERRKEECKLWNTTE
jgi:GH24 family phage-related lysozyme (muramidase)